MPPRTNPATRSTCVACHGTASWKRNDGPSRHAANPHRSSSRPHDAARRPRGAPRPTRGRPPRAVPHAGAPPGIPGGGFVRGAPGDVGQRAVTHGTAPRTGARDAASRGRSHGRTPRARARTIGRQEGAGTPRRRERGRRPKVAAVAGPDSRCARGSAAPPACPRTGRAGRRPLAAPNAGPAPPSNAPPPVRSVAAARAPRSSPPPLREVLDTALDAVERQFGEPQFQRSPCWVRKRQEHVVRSVAGDPRAALHATRVLLEECLQ